MSPPPKRRWPGLVAAYVLLTVVLALPGVPLYYYLDPVHKPLVIRVCTGVLLAFTLHRLVRSARERLERQPASDFAAAARPRQEVTYLAAPFERWQNQVQHSRTGYYYDYRDNAYYTDKVERNRGNGSKRGARAGAGKALAGSQGRDDEA